MPDPAALVKLLGEWMDGDETQQRETFGLLRRSLDEQRPMATSSSNEPDRPTGRRSAWTDYQSTTSPENEACKDWLADLAYPGGHARIRSDYDARHAEGRGILGERPANWAAIG
jgi:hypothetical protein